MDGRDAAWMPGVPAFQHVQRLAPANLADNYAIGAKAKRRSHQIGHRDRAGAGWSHGAGSQRDHIARRALQLARRSDEHTSELQSLMRSSYAVSSLTKKNN